MSEIKHSPAPWRVDATYPTVDVFDANGDHVCEVSARGDDTRHVLAAAPDTLAACLAAKRVLNDMALSVAVYGEQPPSSVLDALAIVDAAIAKAKPPAES